MDLFFSHVEIKNNERKSQYLILALKIKIFPFKASE
jgi:hypothetical protein